MFTSYIAALDIGSSKIAACVMEIKRKRIAGIFFENIPVKGIKKGAIVDSVSFIGCISHILKDLKVKSGINIKSIYVNISGENILTKHSRAVIPLAERGNKVIAPADIQKVNEEARILGSSLDEEIIHCEPFGYAIDSKSDILSPLGLYSHRLEVDLYLICGKLSSIQSLTRAVNQAGYEIKDLFFSGIAASRITFDNELKNGVNVLCDIGSDVTELLFFKNGLLKDIQILSFGGDDLTQELSMALKIPLDLAEDLKRSHGLVGDYRQIKQDKEILLKKNNVYLPVRQVMVCEILTSKAKSICELIRNRVYNIYPGSEINNFLAVGRTVLLEGFLENMENTLGIPVKIGRIARADMASLLKQHASFSGFAYLTYLNSLALACYVLSAEPSQLSPSIQAASNRVLKAVNKVKDIYREYF